MKTELKSGIFESPEQIVDFVNKNKITRENIQAITESDTMFALFYWEITE